MSYSSEVLADSPLAYYRLNEASGSTVLNDSSGNARHGTMNSSGVSATSLLVGDSDLAHTFDGSEAVEVADAAWMDVTTLAIDLLLKPTASPASKHLVCRDDGSGGATNRIFQFRFDASSHLQFVFFDSGGTARTVTGATVLSSGTTYHAGVEFDGTNAFLYLNGAQDGSLAFSGAISVGTEKIAIGTLSGSTSSFVGVIDEVALYTSLGPTRFAAHYAASSGAAGISLGRASETDTARAIAAQVGVVAALNRASETDLARPLSAQVGIVQPLGRASEADTARSIAAVAGVNGALGKVVETDTARPLTPIVNTLISLGRATEADAAQALTFSGGLSVALGRATEIDAARPVAATVSMPLGRATSTESARPIVRLMTTDTNNQVGGLHISGMGVATWEPPVVVPTAFPLLVHNYDKARAFGAPVVVNGRPSYTVTEIAAPATRPRILVGGKDVTFFRGVPTPAPGYRLIEPLDYGAGTLELPQVSPAFETLGTGALRWLRKGKTVVVQRVNTATNAVVSTTYRGFITDFSVRGNTLVCDLGGVVAGRAALRDRQPVLFRQVKDVGNWVYSAVTQSAGVRFTPRLGPVTGIELASRGGTSMLDYINELLALSVHQSGAQWTVGRRPNGTWGMWLKDTTTIDATIYLDDARMVPDLHQSLAEEPNRIFVTCISPDGRRIKFGAYPGFKQGDPPPYPFHAGTPFGEGTTNGDTDTGDGITVMLAHMVTVSYLTPRQNDGAFDAQVTRAIKRLQDDAGLTESGNMNPATWDALYDLSATGYSIVNARILPAAQRPSVKPWNLTASGAISSRNPNHDRTVEVVDRTVNLGAGFTVQEARQYARDLLREANTPNWVGTITCHLGAIRGEHNPGDPAPTSADLMPARDIKPGMNVWLPTFQGGTLVHVSGAEHPANDGSPVLTVDTRARDTMAAWECITRNRESRSNPRRAWMNDHRQSDMIKDHFNEWDEVSGILDDSVHLNSGWNSFGVKAGQAGTTSEFKIHTVDDPTRFVVLVSTRPISPERLTAWNPQPLTPAGTEKWDDPALRNKLLDRGMVYIAGTAEQPCGLWPGKQTDDEGEPTGDPITGKWEDDAGFGWQTFAEPVLHVAVWALEPCRIRAGRIMQNQLEAGA